MSDADEMLCERCSFWTPHDKLHKWVLEDPNGGSNGDGLLWPDDDGEPTLWAPLP